MADITDIQPLIEAKLATMGLELFELKYFKAGKRSTLRIFIDKPGNVSIEDCERASNELSVLLDVENFSINTPYTLEISSPGLDRPLKTARDFSRVKGQMVTLTLTEIVNGKKGIMGALLSSDDQAVVVQSEKGEFTIPISTIVHGKLELDFG